MTASVVLIEHEDAGILAGVFCLLWLGYGRKKEPVPF
jgi:hypothetical protein